MTTIHRLVTSLLLMTLCSMPLAASASSTEFQEELLQRAAQVDQGRELSAAGHTLYAARLTLPMLDHNNQAPLWSDANIEALFKALDTLSGDGLNPTEYRFPELDAYLEKRSAGELTPKELADLELLLSEGFVRAMYNLAFGKVDPVSLDKDINFTRPFGDQDYVPMLVDYVREGRFTDAFDFARPDNVRYTWMRQALAEYRGYQKQGGWEPIPQGKSLKPGQIDTRVAALRRRLGTTGDYAGQPDQDDLFDEALEVALKTFQSRYGQDTDGVMGPKTLAALNKPVEERIQQLRVALERQRWYLHEVKDEFLVADIAGFNIYWVKDNEIIWEEKIQVGKHYTQTPVFQDKIRYLDFNPTWTIPPGILRRSILPKLKKDPDYLDKKGYLLLTRNGERVDPKTVDWASLKGFPYMVRQPPGPDNALGLVKFMFPNPHFVFLHDTNHRELFDRTGRTFSSGCVRLQNPFDLAERLLATQDGWDRKKIDQVIASGKTTRVNLKEPMRIIIAYGTAVVRDGKVYFREDIYKRDAKVLDALNGKFRVRKQDV